MGAKVVYESLVIAFAMYSRIPVPQVKWTDRGMGYALCFFPLVGVVIGGVMAGFSWLAHKTGMGSLAYACIGTAIPVLLTGGIHMDGFLDVEDARGSCQTAERKLEIMKDPHTGAFAIIGGFVYLLLYLAALSELGAEAFPAAAGVYVLERALSGWSVVSFPKAKKDGLASTFARQAQKRAVQAAMVAWGIGAAVFLVRTGGKTAGGLAVAAALLAMAWYYRMAVREFGGMTGDWAGYVLQVCELGMLGVLAAAG